MKLNLNNSELVAVLTAIQRDLDYNDDEMCIESLMSFVKKVNDNIRTFNRKPEELAIEIRNQLEDIKVLMGEAI